MPYVELLATVKSSVLNLLRLQLGKSAVVVSFSSWLPNSELTLANDLFGDIASECNRHLIVPSIRKHLRAFATILCRIGLVSEGSARYPAAIHAAAGNTRSW